MENATKEFIEALIKESKLDEAFTNLEGFLEACENLRDDLIFIKARLSHLNRNQGIIRDEVFERNNIVWGFNNLLRSFQKETIASYFNIKNKDVYFEELKDRNSLLRDLLSNRLLPKGFKVEKLISEGNSSFVFLLNNLNLNSNAVAHVFKTSSISENVKEELGTIVGLRHRNIIKVIDYNLDSFPFFVMTEYIYGPTLTEAIKSTGYRTQFQVVDWLYQLTDALNYLRHKRIFHSNVRPSKIYIDEEWQIMLSPLDVHSVDMERPTYNRFFDVVKYGSPEEFENFNPDSSKLVDDNKLLRSRELSDQYSIGLIGYKAITGRNLFKGDTVYALIESRRRFDEGSEYRTNKLSALTKSQVPKVDEENFPLKTIFDRLLQKNPESRFSSLHKLKKALHPLTKTDYDDESKARNSYRRCLSNNNEFIGDFYKAFFKEDPNALSKFKDEATKKRQKVMLQMAIDILLELDVDARQKKFKQILDKSHNYSSTQFETFIDVLVETVKHNDPGWNDDPTIAEEWSTIKSKVINFINNHFDAEHSKSS